MESESGFSHLIALQVTTSDNHAISIKGLEKIQTSLKPKVTVLRELRPTNAYKLIILFIVPDTLKAAFIKQRIKDAVKVDEADWYGKTAQFVVDLPEEVLRAAE